MADTSSQKGFKFEIYIGFYCNHMKVLRFLEVAENFKVENNLNNFQLMSVLMHGFYFISA